MTTVPNRRLYIDPASGKVSLAFDSTWMWNFPESIVAVNCRQIWDGFVEGQLVDTEFGPEIAQRLFKFKIDVNGLQSLDMVSIAQRQWDIWLIESKDLIDLGGKLDRLVDTFSQLKDHPKLHQLIYTTWEILQSAGPFFQSQIDRFWNALAFLWTYRYRNSKTETLAITDFGMDSTEMAIKLELLSKTGQP